MVECESLFKSLYSLVATVSNAECWLMVGIVYLDICIAVDFWVLEHTLIPANLETMQT